MSVAGAAPSSGGDVGDGAGPGPLYLASVTFTVDHRCFASGDTVAFRPGVNLVVGDQGSGKSTLLAAVVANSSGASKRVPARLDTGADVDSSVEVLSFDFERDSLRARSSFFADPDRMATQLASIYASHGQAVWRVLDEVRARGATGRKVVVLDEPDVALSPRSAHRLAAMFADVASSGSQVIAAVHNPIVIAAFGDVYSLENRAWMSGEAFLAEHAGAATWGDEDGGR